MKTGRILALFLAGVFVVGPAPALQRDGRTLTLTEAEEMMCANGDCILVTEQSIAEALHRTRMVTLLGCRGAT